MGSKKLKKSILPYVGLGISVIGSIGVLSTANAATTPITTITLWESHNGGPVAASEEYLVNWFNRTHPSIHVTIDITKASKKALGALAAGDPPVLAEISHYDGSFLNAHALVSLNPYLKGQKSNFYHSTWVNGEVNGQHYRIMADAKVSQFTYNIKMFQQAGIHQIPQTWTELANDLRLIKEKIPGVVPLAYKD